MPDHIERLFAYGTLKPGFGNYRRIEAHVRSARPGTTQGVLVDLGAFPALLHGDGIVRGVVLDLDPEALRITDHIEGFHPDREHSLYVREEVKVELDDGGRVVAWTYFFGDPKRIADRPRLEVGRLNATPVFESQGKVEPERDEGITVDPVSEAVTIRRSSKESRVNGDVPP